MQTDHARPRPAHFDEPRPPRRCDRCGSPVLLLDASGEATCPVCRPPESEGVRRAVSGFGAVEG